MQVTRLEVIRLYKNLLLYSRSLKLTDKDYFKGKITQEFKIKKTLTNPEDIAFAYQVRPYYEEVQLFKMLLLNPAFLFRGCRSLPRVCVAFKHTIDYSLLPKINECDVTEQFVRGGGPGGSAVNKNSNCVVLTHIPTGTVIKCHQSRCQDENRKIARELLAAKLDDILNGEDSVASQKKKLEEKKFKRNEYKKKKMAQMKSDWKKREGLA